MLAQASSRCASLRGQRDDVGRRALQHRDVRGRASAISGTSVTAVAPLPITTTRLPA